MAHAGAARAEDASRSPHLRQLAGDWSVWRLAAVRGAGLPFDLLDSLAPPEPLEGATTPRPDTEAVDAILRRHDFRTALTWQNPDLMRNWVAGYVRAVESGRRPALHRRERRDALIARYLQRYCAKNETVGFFGALAWAELTDTPTGLAWGGDGGIRRGSVHFEVWAVRAVADAWRHDPRVVPFLPVRLVPSHCLDGDLLLRPRRQPQRLDGRTSALLSAVGRHRRVGEVATALGPSVEWPAAVTAMFDLHERGILQVGFLVPCDAYPEDHLRRQVEALPAGAPHTDLLADLDALAAVKEAVAAAAEPEDLLAALDQADAVLAKLTRRPAPTAPARPFGRTPLYLDCRRDLDVTVGAGALALLGDPLGIALDAARWLAGEVGDAAERQLRARYTDLRRQGREATLSELQLAAAGVLVGGDWIDEIRRDFQLRWAEILPWDATGPVRLRGARVRPLASALFPARPPRWAASRQHSPDLMLARSPDGGTTWVLGELHVALNTLESRVFLTQADDQTRLVDATAADMRHGRVVPVYPDTAREVSSRTYPPPSLDPPGHYRYWSYGADQGHPSGAWSVPGTALRVTERDGRLVAVAPDRWEAPVLEFFGEFLTALVVNLFRPRPPLAHTPRIAIDDLVLCRETWRIDRRDIPVPRGSGNAYRDLRRLAERLGLPRRVFVKVANQPKPFYLDFAAPLLVDNLARAVRRSPEGGEVEVTEMLPGPEELWLVDGKGQRYPAEFRMVAVDQLEVGPVVRKIEE